MNTVNKFYTKKCLALLAINCVLFVTPVNATEWWDSSDQQTGFSGFAPPAEFNRYETQESSKKWRSGSSFNETDKVRYLPVTTKNPWKPVNSMHYKKTFGSQRPWGNVPDRRRLTTNNMKFHDQRFKQWSRTLDASYHNNFNSPDPFNSYSRSTFPFVNGYGFPGSMYSSPLITPSVYPGHILNARSYGAYPGNFYPAGLSTRPWGW